MSLYASLFATPELALRPINSNLSSALLSKHNIRQIEFTVAPDWGSAFQII